MKQLFVYLTLFVFIVSCAKAQEIPTAEWQIKTAVLAAPETYQSNATVLGYNEKGKIVTLRQGSNSQICLADNPFKKGFSVSAYQKDLDEFMARGRALRAAGKEFDEIFAIREKEIKSGALSIPDKASLTVLSGDVNETTQEIENIFKRYVVYMPFATGESTGLPTTATPAGQPWLMDAGTHRAHIMITPQKKE